MRLQALGTRGNALGRGKWKFLRKGGYATSRGRRRCRSPGSGGPRYEIKLWWLKCEPGREEHSKVVPQQHSTQGRLEMEVEACSDHVAVVVELLVFDVLVFRVDTLQPNVSVGTVDGDMVVE